MTLNQFSFASPLLTCLYSKSQSTLPAGKVPLVLGSCWTTGAPTGCDLPLAASPGQWEGPVSVSCKVWRCFQCLCHSSAAVVDTSRQCPDLGCQVCFVFLSIRADKAFSLLGYSCWKIQSNKTYSI